MTGSQHVLRNIYDFIYDNGQYCLRYLEI